MFDWIKKLFGGLPKFDSKTVQPVVSKDPKRELMRRIINAFEMGRTTVIYDAIYIFADGPGNKRQITLSWGVTEFGNMRKFIQEYIKIGGKFVGEFKKYVDLIGKTSLVNNEAFKSLLKKAAREDQVYRDVMDKMYYDLYYNPALEWAENHGIKTPLGILVILDSQIHSGGILATLRNRFSEPTPSAGGDEKRWVRQYCEVRRDWLENHSRKILNKTSIRVKTYLREMDRNNWNLDITPINCNGISVS